MKKLNSKSPTLTMEEAFENFLFAKSAQGVTEKTINGYKSHLHCISKHLDTSIELSSLKKETTYKMIASMRASNLSPNSIASYVRVALIPITIKAVTENHQNSDTAVGIYQNIFSHGTIGITICNNAISGPEVPPMNAINIRNPLIIVLTATSTILSHSHFLSHDRHMNIHP